MADTSNKLPKKMKLKVKPTDKAIPKVKKPAQPDKVIDERVIDISFDEDIKPAETTKSEPLEIRDEGISYLTGVGTQHPVQEMIQHLRNILLNSGFNELENAFFISENDIFKQFKIKSGLLFDKVYYLAENQYQLLGLTSEQIQELQNLRPELNIDMEKFREILSDYNERKISHDIIFQRMMSDFKLTYKEMNKLLDAFPQLKNINPKLTNITLRSTMAPSWLATVAAIMDKESLPLKLFSTGVWFKREQKLNELNLRSHYGASCIIMNEKISINNGKVIADEILDRLGFKDLEYKENDQLRNLNVHSIEQEIFNDDIKIASFGLFSKKILRKYGIDIPVLYINFGLEHMVMVQKGISDIRELMYPQFYKAWKFNDDEIAGAIHYIKEPSTEFGKAITGNMIEICKKNHNAPSPCEFIIWEGAVEINIKPKPAPEQACETPENVKPTEIVEGSQVTSAPQETMKTIRRILSVKIVKREKDSKLCGPAAFNEIVVKNGDVYGIPNLEQNPELAGAVETKIQYLDAFSKLVGSIIEDKLNPEDENEIKQNNNEIVISVVKDMEDINLQMDGKAYRYILSKNKKIDVRGPTFITVEYDLIDPNKKKPETEVEKKEKLEKMDKKELKDYKEISEKIHKGELKPNNDLNKDHNKKLKGKPIDNPSSEKPLIKKVKKIKNSNNNNND